MKNKNFKVIDLFSGCGGFSLGFKKQGFTISQAIEIDEAACLTFENNLDVKPICEDISKIKDSKFKKADVLIGGFPCQPFSLSGLQDGFKGKSGDSFEQCIRSIKLTKPTVVVLENVTGFKKLHGGIFHDLAIRELSDLGFYVKSFELNSKFFSVPQDRTRLFIVATKNNSEIIPPAQEGKIISVKEALNDLVGKENKFANHEPMKHTERIKERFAATLPGESTREAMDRNPSLGEAKITKQCYRRLIPDLPAPTLVANFVTTTIHYSQNRNITAREGARIQSFPDDFIFEGLKTRMSWQEGLSQFEQIGNAVAPRVAEAIAVMTSNILNKKFGDAKKIKLSQTDMFDDLDSRYQMVMKSINKKKKTSGKRGRTSKNQKIYEKIEKMKAGERIKLSDEVTKNQFFFDAAMRRRKIEGEIEETGNEIFFRKL